MKLLKANMLTSLFLHITVGNMSTVMIQKRRTDLYLLTINLQEFVADKFVTLIRMVETLG